MIETRQQVIDETAQRREIPATADKAITLCNAAFARLTSNEGAPESAALERLCDTDEGQGT